MVTNCPMQLFSIVPSILGVVNTAMQGKTKHIGTQSVCDRIVKCAQIELYIMPKAYRNVNCVLPIFHMWLYNYDVILRNLGIARFSN